MLTWHVLCPVKIFHNITGCCCWHRRQLQWRQEKVMLPLQCRHRRPVLSRCLQVSHSAQHQVLVGVSCRRHAESNRVPGGRLPPLPAFLRFLVHVQACNQYRRMRFHAPKNIMVSPRPIWVDCDHECRPAAAAHLTPAGIELHAWLHRCIAPLTTFPDNSAIIVAQQRFALQ